VPFPGRGLSLHPGAYLASVPFGLCAAAADCTSVLPFSHFSCSSWAATAKPAMSATHSNVGFSTTTTTLLAIPSPPPSRHPVSGVSSSLFLTLAHTRGGAHVVRSRTASSAVARAEETRDQPSGLNSFAPHTTFFATCIGRRSGGYNNADKFLCSGSPNPLSQRTPPNRPPLLPPCSDPYAALLPAAAAVAAAVGLWPTVAGRFLAQPVGLRMAASRLARHNTGFSDACRWGASLGDWPGTRRAGPTSAAPPNGSDGGDAAAVLAR